MRGLYINTASDNKTKHKEENKKLKSEICNYCDQNATQLTLHTNLEASFDVLHGNKLFGLLIPHKPRHSEIPRPYILHKLVLLHSCTQTKFLKKTLTLPSKFTKLSFNSQISKQSNDYTIQNWDSIHTLELQPYHWEQERILYRA